MAKKMEGGTLEDLQKKQEHVPAERVGKILSTIQAARAHFKTIDQSNIGEVLKLVEDDYLQLGAQETAWLQRTLRREHNIDVDIGGDESLLSDTIEQPKAPKREKKEISPEEKWRIRKETIINSLKNTFSDPDQLKTAFSVDEKLKEFRNLTAENIAELKEALAKEDIHDRKDTTELPPDAVIHGRPPEAQKKEFIGSRAESDENGVFIEHTNSGYTLIERFGSGDKKRTKQLNDVKISKDLEQARAENLANSLNEAHDGLADRGSIRVSKEGEIKTKYTSKGVKKEIEFKATDIGITDEELAAWDKRGSEFNAARGKMKDKIRAALMNKIISEDFKPTPEPTPAPATPDTTTQPIATKDIVVSEPAPAAKPAEVASSAVQSAEPTAPKKENPTGLNPQEEAEFQTLSGLAPDAYTKRSNQRWQALYDKKYKEGELTAATPTVDTIKSFRVDMAKKELAMQDAERKMEGFFGIFNLEKKGAHYKEASDAYEAAKKAYAEATAELNGAHIDKWLDEQLNLTKERRTAWKEEHGFKDKLSRAWEWFSNANAIEALLGHTDTVKKWREFNESSTGWAKGARLSGAGKFLAKMASKAIYNLGTARGAISAVLIGFGTAEALAGETATLAGIHGGRAAISMAGGYVAGSNASRGVSEWAINRKDKNQAGSIDATLPEKYKATLTQYAVLAESLRRGIPNKRIREAKEAELKELTKKLVTYGESIEGGLQTLQQDTFKKTQEVAKGRREREVFYQGAGLVTGLAFGALGFSRVDDIVNGTGIQYPDAGPAMSRGTGAMTEEQNMSQWRPGQEATKPPLASFQPEASFPPDEMSTWSDVARNQPAAAAQLGKVFGEKGPVQLHKLDAFAKANHLTNPAELKAALNAVVSIEITSDNRLYGEALESALTDLAYKAEAGDALAAATLKKFFASINMNNIDVTDLDQNELHQAMLKKVNMHGANGEVGTDVKNKVHFKNRLIVTTDGKVEVIQGLGKEAAGRVNEIEFAKNLARKVGADPNSVTFKNGWGELGMKLKGHEISIKNAHSFEDYDAIRKHAEEQIVEKTKDAIAENPMKKFAWVTFKNPDSYGGFAGVDNFKSFLINAEHATGYGVAEIPHDLMPGLNADTKLFAIDIGSIDQNPERFGVAVASEAAKGKSIATEVLQPNGTPKEMLKSATEGAITVRNNVERLDNEMGLSRDMAIDFAHMNGVPLDSTPAVFGDFVEETRELYNQLGKTWKPLIDGTTWDKTNIKIMGALPDYSGDKLQTLLAQGKTMTKLSFDQKIAALESLGSKSPKALGSLLDADKVATLTNTTTSYDASQRILTIKNIERNGETLKSVIIDTSTGIVKVDRGFWSSTKTGKLDSIKKLFVR